jgi:hypothetical protein
MPTPTSPLLSLTGIPCRVLAAVARSTATTRLYDRHKKERRWE